MDVNVICGMNAVSALFARRPDDVLRLFFLPTRKAETGAFCAAMARLRRPYRMVDGDELATVAGTGHHGGIAAVAKPREVPIFDRAKPPRERLLLVLDGVGNPHNLGAIARSAAFFGVRALLLGEGLGHAMLSNAAYRTAEGGVEFLDVFRTRDLPGTLAALDPFYRTVVATLHADAAPVGDLPRDRPIALVLGAEETGASPDVIAACRRQVRIAGSGRVQSLNVAQAAAVLLHSLTS